MLRRDFVSKIIEQMVNAIQHLQQIDSEKETEKYLDNFNEYLKTYFEISETDIEDLIAPDEEQSLFLYDEKIKNKQIALFLKSAFIYLDLGEKKKAEDCHHIILNIQQKHADIFEFPTVESGMIETDLEKLKTRLMEETLK